jgi:hypothetical protein
MTDSKPAGAQSPEGDTPLLIAALNYAWTVYDTRITRTFQLLNYYLVASAIVATAYASAINGKHYGLAAIFSVAGIGLSALAFAVGLDEKRTADKAEPALITLEDQIASKLDIDSIRIVKAGDERSQDDGRTASSRADSPARHRHAVLRPDPLKRPGTTRRGAA